MKFTKIIILTIFTVVAFTKISAAGHHSVTFQYGGEFTNLNVVANGNFFSVSGAFIGTNRMTSENGDIIHLNFMCPALFINGDGNGTCKLKDAKSEDFFILSWHCGVDKQCTGDIINGTGRFEGATGVWKWWNDTGWGEGGGTLLTK